MSELKAFDVVLGLSAEDGYPCIVAVNANQNPRELDEEVYLKSEADKVIADLIEKNERLSDESLIKASNTFREIEKEIRHHKYKRCLAMAMWCCDRWADIATPYVKSMWYRKWHKRWLELAEKFKEAK